MIDKVLEFSIRQRVFVVIAVAGLILVGIWAAINLPIDAVPDITNVQVQINTTTPALAPEEIEKLVTFPIETEMGGIENLEEVRSLSGFGLSQVTLVFRDGTDIYRARQLVGERLQNVLQEIPKGANPRLAPITTGLGEIYYYTVSYKDDFSQKPATQFTRLMELTSVQEYLIKPQLRSVSGVTEVNTSGGYEKQIVVMPDPQKMTSAGVTFSELSETLAQNVENEGGGIVEKGGEGISIRSIGRVQKIEEIASIPLKFGSSPSALKVSDVANVGIGSGIRAGTATYDGEETVLGTAMMLFGENSRLVAKRVDAKIRELSKKLPPGIEIKPVYNRTDLVEKTIATVKKNLFEGAILVVVTLLLLLGNIRAALIVALAIPLSMLFAFIGMLQFGVSGNLMSLGAIDFGLIVDGAVVITENVIRQLGKKQHSLGRVLNRDERIQTILNASKEVGRPTAFGVAIITIVYIPILALTGIEGKTFKPMALTVIFALLGALLLALMLIPALCSYFITKKVNEADNAVVRWIKDLYRPVLEWGLNSRTMLIIAAIGLIGSSVILFMHLGAEFVPTLNEGSLLISMHRPVSIGLNSSIEMESEVEKHLLKTFPEIDHIFSRIGTSEVASDPQGVNATDTYIMFKQGVEWRKSNGHQNTKDELIKLMGDEIESHFPGQSCTFSQPIQMRFNEMLSGSRADIAIKIYGDDYDVLMDLASKAKEIIEKIPGAADLEIDAIGKTPVLEVTLDRKATSAYNIQAAEMNHLVHTAFAGEEVGTMVDGNKRYPIVVRMDESERQNLSRVEQLPIRTSEGGTINLGKVAQARIRDQVNIISRESFQRRVSVMVNLRGRDVESFVKEAQGRIEKYLKLPEGYFIEFGGQFENLKQAQARLEIVVPLALGLIFIFIFMALGSLRQTLVVFTCIPLATTGGVFALWIRGIPFSISAGVGFIALSGIAVLNGLVMISFFNQLRAAGKQPAEAVREGSLTRLRPILMTALVAAFGFVPMAVATGTGAEVQRPLATVVIGGILSATFLTLILLPMLYLWIEQRIHSPS